MFARTHQLHRLPSIAIALAVLAVALVAIPFSHNGFPNGHDATAHITYTYLFDRALGQGQFPVRWVEWVRPGESQPLFNFYYPGLYYLIAVVHATGLPLMVSYEATIVLLWWAGASFLFLFLRPWGRLPAALGAVLFALSPYLILDGFVRAAYAELAAISLAPGVLWSCDRLLRTGRTGYALAAAALTGLMLITHLPSVLLFSPICAAYVLYLTLASETTVPRLLSLAAAVALGVGMAAFYLAPSLGELDAVTMSRMTSGYFDYRNHFVEPAQWLSNRWGFGASVPGPDDRLSFQLGLVPVICVVAAAACVIASLVRGRATRAVADMAFWLLVLAAALFVMTAAADPVWRVVKPLHYLQFPWRALMLAALASSIVAARLLSLVERPEAAAIVVIVLLGVHLRQHYAHLEPANYISRSRMQIDDPRWAERPDTPVTAFLDRGFTPIDAETEAPPGLGRWLIEGDSAVVEREMSDDRIVLELDAPRDVGLRLHTHYFPGWRVWIDGGEVAPEVTPGSGFMRVPVSQGRHVVEARFTDTAIRRASNVVSAASVAIWLALFAGYVRRRRRPQEMRYDEPVRAAIA